MPNIRLVSVCDTILFFIDLEVSACNIVPDIAISLDVSIKTGDVIVVPPCKGAAHRLKNTSENEMLVYLDVDTNSSPDVVIYPQTNKVGVFVKGEFPKFYKQDSNVPYYEDE